ncbi:MAG: hypothetical protein J6V25_11595 [Oscillospiraceae bacterium]|nr:hypothetical protein [Oscillospiraceae bacterium]
MFNKKIALLLAVVLMAAVLSGCCLSHEWEEATCVDPKTCAKCDKTEGEALGHSWQEATCDAPKTCSVCAETEGKALDHDWVEATCTEAKTCALCGATEGTELGHEIQWEYTGQDNMGGSCSVCGEYYTDSVDWDLVGMYHIVGNWNGYMVKMDDSSRFVNLPSGTKLVLNDDFTGKLTLVDETYDLTWEFSRYVEASDGDGVILVYDYYVNGNNWEMMITAGSNDTVYLFVYVGDNVMAFT